MMMMIIIVSPSLKGIFIIILECIVYFSSSKGNDYWVWIHVYLCSNWTNKHTHTLNNYLLYLPVEVKLPNTCFQLYFPYPSCSDITWSGEYCTVYIHCSSQLFSISSGNRIDKVFSSLLIFILLINSLLHNCMVFIIYFIIDNNLDGTNYIYIYLFVL